VSGTTTVEWSLADPETLVRTVIRHVVGLLAPAGAGEPWPSADLRDDLLFDSVSLVQLACALEEAFTLDQIADADAAMIRDVEDVEDYVVARMEARGFYLPDGDASTTMRSVQGLESWVLDDQPTG